MAHKSKYYKELDDGVLDLSMQNLKVVRKMRIWNNFDFFCFDQKINLYFFNWPIKNFLFLL